MPHPMETGLRVGEAGTLVPAHHITDVAVTLAGRSVFAASMSFAVLRVTWRDNSGDTRADETVIG